MSGEKSLSVFLDAARWIAAGVVLIGHVAGLLFHETRGFAESNNAVELLVYCLITVGHYAVMIFFVISGYLVGGITLQRWMKSGPSLADYAVARVSRIYTVLLPALVIGMIFDLIGLEFFGDSVLYTGGVTNALLHDVGARTGVEEFALNLALLQGMYVEALGSNGPLWSLSYEWWYYALFAAIAGAVQSRGWSRYVLTAGSVVLVYGMTTYMLLWGSVWLLGLAAYFVLPRVKGSHPIVGLTVILGTLLWACYTANPDYRTDPEPLYWSIGRDFAVALSFCYAMTCFRDTRVPGERLHRFAAKFSYTVYLCHFPALLLLVTIAHEVFGLRIMAAPDAAGFGALVAIAVVMYAFCFGMYWVAERHTDSVRRLLQSVVSAGALLRLRRA